MSTLPWPLLGPLQKYSYESKFTYSVWAEEPLNSQGTKGKIPIAKKQVQPARASLITPARRVCPHRLRSWHLGPLGVLLCLVYERS